MILTYHPESDRVAEMGHRVHLALAIYAQFLVVKLMNVILDVFKDCLVYLPGTHIDQSLRGVHPENSSILK